MRIRLSVLCLLPVLGCAARGPFTGPRKLGGKMVSAAVLNQGRVTYLQYCRACHGEHGRGDGPSAVGLRPPPRDFTQGEFKFAGVLDQMLPRDEDLDRIITSNLHGSAMLGWEVPAPQRRAVIQYIKTFSDAWKADDAVGEPVTVPPDPWGEANAVEAVARGEALYHGYAKCLSCHPAYLSRQAIDEATVATTGEHQTDFRPDMFDPVLKPSDYHNSDGTPAKVLPPNFLFHPLRSIQPGTELHDLYRLLVSGVTGAAMPAWDPDVLPDGSKDIYALAYYVRSLTRLRGTPEALVRREKLAAR